MGYPLPLPPQGWGSGSPGGFLGWGEGLKGGGVELGVGGVSRPVVTSLGLGVPTREFPPEGNPPLLVNFGGVPNSG